MLKFEFNVFFLFKGKKVDDGGDDGACVGGSSVESGEVIRPPNDVKILH